MSQLQPVVEPELVPLTVLARHEGRDRYIPGWLALLLANPKSRFGLVLVAFMIRRRRNRTVDLRQQPDRLQHPRHAPGALVGTTSSGRPIRAATSSRRSSSAPAAP